MVRSRKEAHKKECSIDEKASKKNSVGGKSCRSGGEGVYNR